MNAKEVALCSIFAAIAIALEHVRIPAIFAQVQFYFWEIPVIIALLLFGLKVGFSIAAITAFGQALIFPRALGFLFPFWNLIAMSTFLAAIFLVQRLINYRANGASSTNRVSDMTYFRIKPIVCFTIVAMLVRLSVMPFVNFFMYKFMMPLVIGQIYSDVAIIAMIPTTMVFDAVFTLYTIPIAYMIAQRVNKTLKIGNFIF